MHEVILIPRLCAILHVMFVLEYARSQDVQFMKLPCLIEVVELKRMHYPIIYRCLAMCRQMSEATRKEIKCLKEQNKARRGGVIIERMQYPSR